MLISINAATAGLIGDQNRPSTYARVAARRLSVSGVSITHQGRGAQGGTVKCNNFFGKHKKKNLFTTTKILKVGKLIICVGSKLPCKTPKLRANR